MKTATDILTYFFLAYCVLLVGEIYAHHMSLLASGVFAPMLLPVPMPASFRRPFARARA